MDPIESVEYNGVDEHGWKQVVSRKRNRKQKPADHAANENLVSRNRSEQKKPADWEVSLAKAAEKIGPSDLTDFLDRVPDRYPPAESFRIARFLDFYESALAGVPCPWREMFKDSDLSNLFHVFHVSYFFYKISRFDSS